MNKLIDFALNVFLILVIFFTTSVYLNARYYSNGLDNGYCSNSTDLNCGVVSGERLLSATAADGNVIKALIIQGAGQFLYSTSNIFQLSNRIEVSELYGPDFNEMSYYAELAWGGMTDAKITYWQLIEETNGTPYNSDAINSLKNFDYKEFAKYHHLNEAVFKRVEGFLKNGNIRGTHVYIYKKMDRIIVILETIKRNLEESKIPDNSLMWELQQEVSETMLFGQYLSRVIYSV